ncbi:MAG: response regulator [Vampirovibrionales bacterium]|nr:response regulator [Vampirovibrionales bacterium]
MPQTKVILLVEDNPDDERLTLMGFRENRILNEIVVARDGVEAINYLEGKGDYADRLGGATSPQLIVLDLKLPKVDGIEVLKHIRQSEHNQYTPVVILTSSTEERDIVESYQLGVNAYVQKPIDFMDFTEAVKHLGMFWLLLNQAPNDALKGPLTSA